MNKDNSSSGDTPPSGWFDDIPVLGKLSPDLAASKLQEIGETAIAAQLTATDETEKGNATFRGSNRRGWWPFQDKAWQHTAHAFGYLAPAPTPASTPPPTPAPASTPPPTPAPASPPASLPASPANEPLPIRHVSSVAADPALKNAQIKVTLDHLRVADYPGGGIHRILFDFYAQNQVTGNKIEHLHFNATYRVLEGEQAGIRGYPIFVGLNVGKEGIAFKCFTVNVRNDNDEAFLGFLESDVFKEGLKLAKHAQPVIGLFSETVLSITRSIAKRNRNVPVQDFYLGLDFSNLPTRAPLAVGSYIVVQIPESFQTVWDWSEWQYNPATGQITSKTASNQLIPYNYMVFSISICE